MVHLWTFLARLHYAALIKSSCSMQPCTYACTCTHVWSIDSLTNSSSTVHTIFTCSLISCYTKSWYYFSIDVNNHHNSFDYNTAILYNIIISRNQAKTTCREIHWLLHCVHTHSHIFILVFFVFSQCWCGPPKGPRYGHIRRGVSQSMLWPGPEAMPVSMGLQGSLL